MRDPFGIPVNNSDSEFTRYAFTASGLITPIHNVTSVVGVDVEIEEGDTKGLLDFGFTQMPTDFDLERTTYSAFAEVEAFVGSLSLQSGLRFDMPENFSNRISPNIGVKYQLPNLNSNLRMNWGKGFKLPSFFCTW